MTRDANAQFWAAVERCLKLGAAVAVEADEWDALVIPDITSRSPRNRDDDPTVIVVLHRRVASRDRSDLL